MTVAMIPAGRSGAIGPVLLAQFGQLAIGTVDGRVFHLAILCSHIELAPCERRERSNRKVREWRAKRREAKRLAAGTSVA